MNVFDWVLSRPEFEEAPPVVVDIGASGGLNPAWRRIRRHSVCIAFDGDENGLDKPRSSKDYKRLHIFNLLVTPDKEGPADFYFTKSAKCSSLLLPNREQLSSWAFADRFEVMEKRKVKTTSLTAILRELGLQRIDWFKTDSQGTDLRLFTSLADPLLSRVLVAEFEPGILDAYSGEDKLWQVMSFMEKKEFWMSDIRMKGSQYFKKECMRDFSPLERKYSSLFLKSSPGWAEVTYLNCLQSTDFNSRDFLLGWVFASLKQQYGFALQVATTARERFDDPIFGDLRKHSVSAIRRSYFKPAPYFNLTGRLIAKLKRHG